MTVSNRCNSWLNQSYGLMEGMKLASQNPFDEVKNPSGCINLGTAENTLMFSETSKKLKDIFQNHFSLTLSDIKYNDFLGLPEFRKSLSSFLASYLKSDLITQDSVSIHNGCGSAVESLFNVLCDPGDYVLCPSPYYGGFDMDTERRAKVNIEPIDLQSKDSFAITLGNLQSTYENAVAEGKKVKALLVMNPINPLGTIYSKKTVQNMIKFCNEVDIHLVMDEIYALSVFDEDDVSSDEKFASIYTHEIPDIQKVHILWGFSKDFCLNGFRVGVAITKNETVRQGLNSLSYFTGVSSLTQRALQHFLDDRAFVDNFFKTNHERLRKLLDLVISRISDLNSKCTTAKVRYLRPRGGFFIWVDFSDFLKYMNAEDNVTAEKTLFLKLIKDAGIYIAPGAMAFHAIDAGWFRIIFGAPENILNLALDRTFNYLLEISK